MKHVLKIFLLLALCVTLLAACDLASIFSPEEETTTAPDDTTTTNPDPDSGKTPASEAMLVIVDNKGYTNYKIITGDAGAIDVWSAFATDLEKKTGMNASKQKFAQYKETSLPRDGYEILINVKKGADREAATALFETQPLSKWSVQVVDTRVVVNARSTEGLKDAIKALKESFRQDEAGNWGVAKDLSLSGNALEKGKLEWALMSDKNKAEYNAVIESLDALPFFETKNGVFHATYPTGGNGYSVAIENATKAEYDAQLEKIRNAGYTQYSVNTMSQSDGTKLNVYHTLTAEKTHIFMQWQEATKMVRINVQPAGALPSLEKVECTAEDTVPVTIAQTQLAAGSMGGMGYVYQLADGKLIVVDGGAAHDLTNSILMQYIKDCAKKAEMETPVIAMWIFSHPHTDHIGVAASESFMENAKNEGVVIESFAYNFAEQTYHPDDHTKLIGTLESKIATFYPDATIYRRHTGQVYYFKGMTIEILATQEEVYPLVAAQEQNDLCINWRVTFGDGKTAMFLADATFRNNPQLANIYGSYLKSDILQMAHHGLSGATMDCYQAIDPDICLWPSPYDRFMNLWAGDVIFYDKTNPQNSLAVHKDQWGYGYRYVLDADGDPINMEGNEAKNPEEAQKVVLCAPNLWILDESVKKRYDYHNNETVIIGADLSVTIERTADSDLLYDLPELPTTEDGRYNGTGYDYKSLDDIPGGIETITNWEKYFKN